MGPAVTSEAVSCEREKRLRTTASLSPHNTQSDPLPTGMNPEGSVGLTGCQSITSVSSCQIVEPTACVSACSSGPQLDQSVEDDRLSSLPGESLNLCNVNIVNLKDIHSHHKVSIFIKNNASRKLPNGGTGHSLGSNEKIVHQVAAAASCDGVVPSGSVGSSQIAQTRLLNSSQTDNGLSDTNRIHHMMIIIPKTPVTEETEKSQGLRESETVGSAVARSVTTVEVNQEKTAHSDTLKDISRIVSRQRRLNAGASRLLKRLRRLQCREVNSAVKEKLGQVVTSIGEVLGDRSAVTAMPKSTNKDPLGSRELTALSTAELVSYVQKMQSSQQHSFFSRPAAPRCSHSADLTESPSKLDEVMRLHLRDTSGRLTSNMRHLKSALDSDATESSSGGESSDESPPVPAELPNAASASAA